MAGDRHYELEDLVVRTGYLFQPADRGDVVVDDSPSLDTEIFNLEEFEGADWILVSDDRRSTRPTATSCSRTSRPLTAAGTAHRGDRPETDDEIVEDEPEPDVVEELE